MILPSGGVLFARNADGDAKTAARQLVIDLVLQEQWWPGGLHMLTMPGVNWRFERKILGQRQEGWMRHRSPHGTYFTACENDRALYFASVPQMPGLHNPDSELKQIKPYAFAEMGVKTRFASIFFANVDDFMANAWDGGWDVVWLDYTGPLTVERLAVIQQFYLRCVRSILVVTSLKARFNKPTLTAIRQAGGHSQWLRAHLAGEVLHDIEYFDTSTMAQFALRKTERRPV